VDASKFMMKTVVFEISNMTSLYSWGYLHVVSGITPASYDLTYFFPTLFVQRETEPATQRPGLFRSRNPFKLQVPLPTHKSMSEREFHQVVSVSGAKA